jgi:hypothetical protein
MKKNEIIKKAVSAFLLVMLFMSLTSWFDVASDIIADGSQPQIAADSKGIIRVVFGRQDEIYCATSADKGVTFSKPVLVARVPEMHLGMSRGPQLASSANYSMITAMDKSGNIHWFKLNNSAKEWKNMGTVNDLEGSAPEGLMSIAADKKDNFYAVWLDIRTGRRNQICFSSITGYKTKWSKNRLAYQSPDEHVCECCQPHIAVRGSQVAIMFRNWLNGSRDLYFIESVNAGRTFAAAEKLGMDTWKLNGCPMDGGGITINNSSNVINTTWQRKGMVYFCQPGQPEIYLGTGRDCSISGTGDNPLLTFQNNDTVKVMQLKNRHEIAVGNGSYLKAVRLPDSKVLCVWETNNKIKFKKI